MRRQSPPQQLELEIVNAAERAANLLLTADHPKNGLPLTERVCPACILKVAPEMEFFASQKHVFVGKPKRQFRLREFKDLGRGREVGLWAGLKDFVRRFK